MKIAHHITLVFLLALTGLAFTNGAQRRCPTRAPWWRPWK